MAGNAEDHCAILGLKDAGSRKQVESAFRRRALACHPDRNPKDPLAKKKFLRLSRAKEVLLSKLAGTGQQPRAERRQRKPNDEARDHVRSAAAKANKARRVREQNKRCADAETLRQREAAAAKEHQLRKRLDEEAKLRRDVMFADEIKRERAAAMDRQRAAVFDVWWAKRKAKAMNQEQIGAGVTRGNSNLSQSSALWSLVEKFAASAELTLNVAGPLTAEQRAEVAAAANSFGCNFTIASGNVLVAKPHLAHDTGSDDSPWEPPTETRTKQRKKSKKGLWAKSNNSSSAATTEERGQIDRHQRAIERLASRHHSGDRQGLLRGDPTVLPGRSWWVHDEEADRYARYVDQCGF